MKKLISVFGLLALVVAVAGCGEHRRVTTTSKETIETAPMDPVVTESRTTHTETHTSH
ncbi:MAG TPA: hypothetical protein VN634_12895 [Candidatus Limnocylindrales bacterium]|nr:hypothetical protein [Candidatus Limnocylindrales bacterium]